LLPEDLGFTGFLDRKEKHNKAIEAAKVARLTAAEGSPASASASASASTVPLPAVPTLTW